MSSANDLRRDFRSPADKEPCYVCGKWRAITHWHHVPSLSSVAEADVDVSGWSWPVFALCPNHHAVIHALYGNGNPLELLSDLTMAELPRLAQVVSAERDVWTMLKAFIEDDVAELFAREREESAQVKVTYCAALEKAMREAELDHNETVSLLYRKAG